MSESLNYRQMKDFSAKHPHEKFYQLDTERELFGFFYVGFDGEGHDVSTLIWQGTLQNPLDWEAFVSLPSHIDPRWTQNIPFSPF